MIITFPNYNPSWANYSPHIILIILLILVYILSSIIITPINNLLYKHYFCKFENNKIYLFLKQNNIKVILFFAYLILIIQHGLTCIPNFPWDWCSLGYSPIYFPFNYLFAIINKSQPLLPNQFIYLDILMHLLLGYLLSCLIFFIYTKIKNFIYNKIRKHK